MTSLDSTGRFAKPLLLPLFILVESCMVRLASSFAVFLDSRQQLHCGDGANQLRDDLGKHVRLKPPGNFFSMRIPTKLELQEILLA